MKNLKRVYFNWLYDIADSRHRKTYRKLCDVLYNRPFVWSVANDDNRCQDGKDLREYFINERRGRDPVHAVDQFFEEDCTVFEVLVALAKRMDFEMYHPSKGERPQQWFSIMIRNLGLDHLSDDYVTGESFPPTVTNEIDQILEIWLNRKYDAYGNGGLFPIRGNCPRDMRRTEIWYQMMAYLQENYEL